MRLNSDRASANYQELELKFGFYDEVSNETYLGLTDDDFLLSPSRRYLGSQVDVMDAGQRQMSARYFLRLGDRFDLTTTAYRNDFERNWFKLESVLGTRISDVLSRPDDFSRELGVLRGANSESGALRVRANNGWCARPPSPIETSVDRAGPYRSVHGRRGGRWRSLQLAGAPGRRALGVLYPERVERLLVLCAAHRSHPMAMGLRVLQRRIVALSAAAGRETEGLALARALAMTTYRTPEEFEQRFVSSPSWEDGLPRFAVEEYLDVQGERFSRRFDANAFGILSQSLDLHRVEPEDITVPTTVVSVDSDTLVPPWLVAELARRLPSSGRAIRIASSFGHDAFLKEHQVVSRLVRNVLDVEAHHA